MDEASRGPRWRLTVWFDRSGDSTTFDFDVKPEISRGTKVFAYHGERQGHAVEVNINIDRVAAWNLEEIPR
jgi:hypothetical protein